MHKKIEKHLVLCVCFVVGTKTEKYLDNLKKKILFGKKEEVNYFEKGI
jgi:hypothetical protein